MQHTKSTDRLRKIFTSVLLISVMVMTACGKTENAKAADISMDDIPEFAFGFSYSPEDPDASGSSVTYICKNGDILEFCDGVPDNLTLDERMEKHAKGEYKDYVTKTVPQKEVAKQYKTFLSVIDKHGTRLLEYPDAVPSVEAPSYDWFGFYYEEGKLRYADLHKNFCMTDVSSEIGKVNDLYEWIDKVK